MNFKVLAEFLMGAVLFALPLGGCDGSQTHGRTDTLASGKLLSIGRAHLVMQSDDRVMFVSVDEADKPRLLTSLNKGDQITLLGKKDIEEVGTDHQRMSADVYEIVKSDGTRIALH